MEELLRDRDRSWHKSSTTTTNYYLLLSLCVSKSRLIWNRTSDASANHTFFVTESPRFQMSTRRTEKCEEFWGLTRHFRENGILPQIRPRSLPSTFFQLIFYWSPDQHFHGRGLLTEERLFVGKYESSQEREKTDRLFTRFYTVRNIRWWKYS
jgi:hypothetical protein